MRARVLVSVAVAATIALGTAGCGFMTPQSTTEIYDASDGVSASVGTVDVRNAILLTKNGTDVRFIATLVNSSDSARTVTIQAKDSSEHSVDVRIPANAIVDLAKDTTADEVVFSDLNAKPGSLVKVFFTYPSAEGTSVRVPVLTGELDEYRPLLPTPTPSVAPTGGTTVTPTPLPSNTPTPAAG